jgi:selenocysteine lyase/cysteine desulfurase
MDTRCIAKRDKELLELCFTKLKSISGLFILGDNTEKRIGVVSFGIEGIHYNLIVRLLNDRFGIQVRGGLSCASTYGHHLFNLDNKASKKIINDIEDKNLTDKPGWVRLSLHPVTTNEELFYICDSIREVVENIEGWHKDYTYNPKSNEFDYNNLGDEKIIQTVKDWFII